MLECSKQNLQLGLVASSTLFGSILLRCQLWTTIILVLELKVRSEERIEVCLVQLSMLIAAIHEPMRTSLSRGPLKLCVSQKGENSKAHVDAQTLDLSGVSPESAKDCRKRINHSLIQVSF